MSIEEIENEEIKFKQIDRDDNGHLIWKDFLNYHSIIMLQRRTKVFTFLKIKGSKCVYSDCRICLYTCMLAHS